MAGCLVALLRETYQTNAGQADMAAEERCWPR
jgi:hypothetical protein